MSPPPLEFKTHLVLCLSHCVNKFLTGDQQMVDGYSVIHYLDAVLRYELKKNRTYFDLFEEFVEKSTLAKLERAKKIVSSPLGKSRLLLYVSLKECVLSSYLQSLTVQNISRVYNISECVLGDNELLKALIQLSEELNDATFSFNKDLSYLDVKPVPKQYKVDTVKIQSAVEVAYYHDNVSTSSPTPPPPMSEEPTVVTVPRDFNTFIPTNNASYGAANEEDLVGSFKPLDVCDIVPEPFVPAPILYNSVSEPQISIIENHISNDTASESSCDYNDVSSCKDSPSSHSSSNGPEIPVVVERKLSPPNDLGQEVRPKSQFVEMFMPSPHSAPTIKVDNDAVDDSNPSDEHVTTGARPIFEFTSDSNSAEHAPDSTNATGTMTFTDGSATSLSTSSGVSPLLLAAPGLRSADPSPSKQEGGSERNIGDIMTEWAVVETVPVMIDNLNSLCRLTRAFWIQPKGSLLNLLKNLPSLRGVMSTKETITDVFRTFCHHHLGAPEHVLVMVSTCAVHVVPLSIERLLKQDSIPQTTSLSRPLPASISYERLSFLESSLYHQCLKLRGTTEESSPPWLDVGCQQRVSLIVDIITKAFQTYFHKATNKRRLSRSTVNEDRRLEFVADASSERVALCKWLNSSECPVTNVGGPPRTPLCVALCHWITMPAQRLLAEDSVLIEGYIQYTMVPTRSGQRSAVPSAYRRGFWRLFEEALCRYDSHHPNAMPVELFSFKSASTHIPFVKGCQETRGSHGQTVLKIPLSTNETLSLRFTADERTAAREWAFRFTFQNSSQLGDETSSGVGAARWQPCSVVLTSDGCLALYLSDRRRLTFTALGATELRHVGRVLYDGAEPSGGRRSDAVGRRTSALVFEADVTQKLPWPLERVDGEVWLFSARSSAEMANFVSLLKSISGGRKMGVVFERMTDRARVFCNRFEAVEE